uniref:Uncharacterized protein n=1 Tax=Prymnesium polylepis TaxID=72548 RepID=A0A7S4M1T2_9EUKA
MPVFYAARLRPLGNALRVVFGGCVNGYVRELTREAFAFRACRLLFHVPSYIAWERRRLLAYYGWRLRRRALILLLLAAILRSLFRRLVVPLLYWRDHALCGRRDLFSRAVWSLR